jgi:hypothetical protein
MNITKIGYNINIFGTILQQKRSETMAIPPDSAPQWLRLRLLDAVP